AFSSSPLMSALQTAFSLSIDAQITTDKAMKKILKSCSSSSTLCTFFLPNKAPETLDFPAFQGLFASSDCQSRDYTRYNLGCQIILNQKK
ncbi:MAG: hypothetical protein IKN04_08860, partial [Clostridia bacterium]|nr:hypothetical protein [Clostridia bacterium]